MLQAFVAVQPPTRVQIQANLIPNVVGKLTVQPADPSVYYFAMAVLLDSHAKPLAAGLNGITTITGSYLENASSSKETVVFPFWDASISETGSFRIRLDIYKVLYEQPEGATMVTQVETEQFGVANSPVSPHRPNDDERKFIQKLRDAGITRSAESQE